MQVGLPAISLFRPLDFVPLPQHGIRRGGIRLVEHVRVPPDQFLADPPSHVVEREMAGFRRDFAVENHLQQQVAKLFLEVLVVTALDRVHRFISFLDQVRHQREVRLLRVPRAATGRAQAVHD